jgi:hypothetical protein
MLPPPSHLSLAKVAALFTVSAAAAGMHPTQSRNNNGESG